MAPNDHARAPEQLISHSFGRFRDPPTYVRNECNQDVDLRWSSILAGSAPAPDFAAKTGVKTNEYLQGLVNACKSINKAPISVRSRACKRNQKVRVWYGQLDKDRHWRPFFRACRWAA